MASNRRALCILVEWAAGFVVGYLVMLIMLRGLAGQWGLTIAEWRHAHVATNLQDLWVNFLAAMHDMSVHLTLVGLVPGLAALTLCIAFGIADSLRNRAMSGPFFWPLIAAVAAALATYVQSVPFGLAVEPRTPYGLFAAAFVLVLLLLKRCRLVGCALTIAMASCMYVKNHDSLAFVNTVTHTWRDAYRRIPVDPSKTDGVNICSPDSVIGKAHSRPVARKHLKSWHTEGYHENDRQVPILYAAGYRGAFDWHADGKCAAVPAAAKHSTDTFEWAVQERRLYVWHRTDD